MSCPSDVVPSGCDHEGGNDGGNCSAFGSVTGVNHCGNSAKMVKTSRINSPTTAFRLCSRERQRPPRRRGVSSPVSVPGPLTSSAVIWSPLRPGPRIEPGYGEVTEQQCQQHGDREE